MKYDLVINYKHGEKMSISNISGFHDLQENVIYLLDRNHAIDGEISSTQLMSNVRGDN